MIWFYSGTPGSGKSFHMAKEIRMNLWLRRNVVSTVNIDLKKISKRRKLGNFTYVPILELTPKFLYEYAYRNHKKGKEGQTLLIIDECQIIFNPREYQRKGRSDWILFFTQHRHLGYNIIMTSQFDRLVDRQIRSLFEYEVKHRKVNNMGPLFLLPWTIFAMVTYWYGVKVIVQRQFMLYNKKVAGIYDSYVMFDEFKRQLEAEEAADFGTRAHPDTNPDSDETCGSAADRRTGVGGTRPQGSRTAKGTRKNLFDRLIEIIPIPSLENLTKDSATQKQNKPTV